jgi:hypothetical protein
MTKRLTAALLCAVASSALCGVATAEAKRLSYKTASQLAAQLAKKQVSGRNVVSFHLQTPSRASATKLVFYYDDRTADNVFCTARLIVSSSTRGRTTTVRAFFAGQRCAGIPSEVLRFEALTRQAQRDVRLNAAATVDALDAYQRAVERCRNVSVPRARARDAKALFGLALVEALERANDAALGNFVTGLLDVQARNATLAAGASAWADLLATLRALPTVDDPCASLKAWKRAGFTAEAAPIDFAAFHALDRRATADTTAILRAANLMAVRGAFLNAAIGFTPNGLLYQGIAGNQRAKPVFR